jgi:hypothetical protein
MVALCGWVFVCCRRNRPVQSHVSGNIGNLVAQRPTPPRTPDVLPTSTHHNSANIDSISKAIEAMGLRELRDNIPASKYAAKYSVDQTTLRRRWKGVQAPGELKDMAQQNLSLQQELGLIEYIKELTNLRILPTRDMIQNFGSAVAERDLSESWVQRFIERNRHHLISC